MVKHQTTASIVPVNRTTERAAADFIISERWYGDGAPVWVVGDPARSCQSAAEAEKAREDLSWILNRNGHHEYAVRRLAGKLTNCRPRQRCHDGCCPSCMRAVQRWLVSHLISLTASVGNESSLEWAAISIIPTRDDAINPGVTSNPYAARRRTYKGLRYATIDVAIGALDFSFNEEPDERSFEGRSERGCVHAYVFAPLKDVERGRALLRKAFPIMPLVPRPVQVKRCDYDPRAFAYAFKPDFNRRVTLPMSKAEDGTTLRRRNTRDRPLRVQQKVKLAVMLSEFGLLRRLILRGFGIRFGKTDLKLFKYEGG